MVKCNKTTYEVVFLRKRLPDSGFGRKGYQTVASTQPCVCRGIMTRVSKLLPKCRARVSRMFVSISEKGGTKSFQRATGTLCPPAQVDAR